MALREMLSGNRRTPMVFAVDVVAQPQERQRFFEIDPHVHANCARALPLASAEDVVVLVGDLEQTYYTWLRELGLSTDKVATYGAMTSKQSLAEMIIANPAPVLSLLVEEEPALYVPFYCGQTEHLAAEALSCELFGCEESITRKFFNKERFKQVCIDLGIEVVPGYSASTQTSGKALHAITLEKLTVLLLHEYQSLIIRGTEGSSGSSVFQVDKNNLEQVREEILRSHASDFLLEPMLDVVASPNDQWIINTAGDIGHLGITAQLFTKLCHRGNVRGLYLSDRCNNFISETSRRIVECMKEEGYRGIIGIDYIITPEGIFPIENNARMNGSSFALGIVEHLERVLGPIACWKFYRGISDFRSFEELKSALGSLLYKGTSINCVFPFDCDTLSINGKFSPLILAEDMFHLEFIEKALDDIGIALL